MDYIDFNSFSTNGVEYSDTAFVWMTKTNGIIREIVDSNVRVSDLVTALYSGPTPNWVDLDTSQIISGQKLFPSGSTLSPPIKIGSAGLYYNSSGGVNLLTSTHGIATEGNLVVAGAGVSLRGVSYITPAVAPASQTIPSFMSSLRSVSGTNNPIVWTQVDSMIDGATIVYAAGTFKVGTITAANIQSGVIDASKMATNSIATIAIQNGAVNGLKIATAAIGGSHISAGVISPDKLTTGTLSWTTTTFTTTAGTNDLGYGETSTINVHIGRSRSGNGDSRINLYGSTSDPDGKAVIQRLGGNEGALRIFNNGGGDLIIETEATEYAGREAAIIFKTKGGSTKFTIGAGGNVTVADLAGTGTRNVQANASGILTPATSDRTLKKEIEDLNEGIGEKLLALRPVSFKWKDSKQMGDEKCFGFIAQDVREVFPDLVYDVKGKLGFDYSSLVPMMVKTLQAQAEEIQFLKSCLPVISPAPTLTEKLVAKKTRTKTRKLS